MEPAAEEFRHGGRGEMFAHDPGPPPKDDPGQQAADQGIANANPGGGQAVFPSELTGITDKYHSGKVGGAIAKGGEPGPHTPSSQNKVIDIGGMATGIESHSQHDGKKDNQHQQFNSHLNILRIHFNN